MLQYIVRRTIQALPVLFLISVVSFVLMLQAPGGPAAQFNQNPRISHGPDRPVAEELVPRPAAHASSTPSASTSGGSACGTATPASLLSSHGLPNFLPAGLGGGTNGLLHGDFGYSIQTGQPVLSLIMERLPATIILMGTAFVLWATDRHPGRGHRGREALQLLRPVGDVHQLHLLLAAHVLARAHPDLHLRGDAALAPGPGDRERARRRWPRSARPAYWAALAANPLPNLWDIGAHLVLPVLTLIAVSIAGDSRFVRSAMLDSLHQDYVRTARAKGIRETQVIVRHAFRNALLPIVTNLALEIAFLFSGAIVTETVFSWPGMGRLYFEGVNDRDYFLLMGILAHRLGPGRVHEPGRGRRLRDRRSAHPLRLRRPPMAIAQRIPRSAASSGAPTHEVATADVEVALESLSQWQLAWRRFKRHRLALIGLGIFAFMVRGRDHRPDHPPVRPAEHPGRANCPAAIAPSLAAHLRHRRRAAGTSSRW